MDKTKMALDKLLSLSDKLAEIDARREAEKRESQKKEGSDHDTKQTQS